MAEKSFSFLKKLATKTGIFCSRQRAKAVGLDPMKPGRHSDSDRRKWLKQLKRLEKQNGISHE